MADRYFGLIFPAEPILTREEQTEIVGDFKIAPYSPENPFNKSHGAWEAKSLNGEPHPSVMAGYKEVREWATWVSSDRYKCRLRVIARIAAFINRCYGYYRSARNLKRRLWSPVSVFVRDLRYETDRQKQANREWKN